ncbi:MAG: RNA polymerase sigma factor, partial [Byssovorax sp.]
RARAPAHALPGLRAVFDAHADFVARALRYLGVPPSDLDDALQEVFLVVHARLGELTRPEALRAWLRQIARRVAMAARRKHAQRREQLGEPQDPPLDFAATPEAAHVRRDLLLHLLDQLPDEQREVFVLYEIEEMSMREVAELINCPLQTAYSRHRAARERLEQAALRLDERGSR